MRKFVVVIGLAAQILTPSTEAAQGREEPSYRIDQAPDRLAAGVAMAEAAIRALQRRLSGRLQEEMRKGGPAQAVAVCRDEAQTLTAETARDQGVRIGRSSHRLRNPGNEAPSWTRRFVEAGAGRKAASVEAAVVDLGDRVGVLRPLGTAALCTRCHGPAEALSPDVRAMIETAYPQDRATGFEEGDLRGFIWAEAPLKGTPVSSNAPVDRGAGVPQRVEELAREVNLRGRPGADAAAGESRRSSTRRGAHINENQYPSRRKSG